MKMKNIFNILSILFGTVAVLTSCHREDIPCNEIEVGENPISFSTVYASLDTKTDEANAGTTEPSITEFNVWASRTIGTDVDYGVLGSAGQTVEYNSNLEAWTYSPVRYWQEGSYDFLAVANTPESCTGILDVAGLALSFGNDGWDITEDHSDIILANENVENAAGSVPGSVALEFSHQLAKINFCIKNTDPRNPTITIKDVSISGNKTVASGLNIGSQSTWIFPETESAAQSLTIANASTSTDSYTETTGDFLVFPQMATLTVSVTYDDVLNGVTTSDYEKSATITTTWVAGKIYSYQIKLSSDQIQFAEPKVTDWQDGGAADTEIEF